MRKATIKNKEERVLPLKVAVEWGFETVMKGYDLEETENGSLFSIGEPWGSKLTAALGNQ